MPARPVAGADWCGSGWLVLSRSLTQEVSASVVTTEELFARLPSFQVLAIDIPIGLEEAGPRLCDQEARKKLGFPRSCSVFPAPVRAVLGARTYLEACEASARACGKKLSKQTFGILKLVDAVDQELRRVGPLKERVFEVHPELCFREWAGRPMTHGKKCRDGLGERRHLVDSVYPGVFQRHRDAFRPGHVKNDDLLDALAALWTAERIAAGTATVTPSGSAADKYGLRMQIHA